MKIIQFEVDNVKLFDNSMFKINFQNRSKVHVSGSSNAFYHTSKSLYLPSVVAILGNNATGKTTALNIFAKTLGLLFDGEKLNDEEYKLFLNNLVDNDKLDIQIKIALIDGNELLKIKSVISFDNFTNKYQYVEESVKQMKVISSTKTSLINEFILSDDDFNTNLREHLFDQEVLSLPSDLSVFSIYNKFESIHFDNTLSLTDVNFLMNFMDDIPAQWLEFLDSSLKSIKPLYIEGNIHYNIIFKSGEEYTTSLTGATQIISSGTAKALSLFSKIMNILKNGGYLFIDEIENHLNKVIVEQIIDLFSDERVNIPDATIIFSTHYTEILDKFIRMDNIFIMSKEQDKVKVDNLRELVSRTDVKKSEIYASTLKGVGIDYSKIKAFKVGFKDMM